MSKLTSNNQCLIKFHYITNMKKISLIVAAISMFFAVSANAAKPVDATTTKTEVAKTEVETKAVKTDAKAKAADKAAPAAAPVAAPVAAPKK